MLLVNLTWPPSSWVTCMWQNGTGNKRRKNLWPVGDNPDTVNVPSVRQWNLAVPTCSEYLSRGSFQMWLVVLQYDLPQSKPSFSCILSLKKSKGHLCCHLKPITGVAEWTLRLKSAGIIKENPGRTRRRWWRGEIFERCNWLKYLLCLDCWRLCFSSFFQQLIGKLDHNPAV